MASLVGEENPPLDDVRGLPPTAARNSNCKWRFRQKEVGEQRGGGGGEGIKTRRHPHRCWLVQWLAEFIADRKTYYCHVKYGERTILLQVIHQPVKRDGVSPS